VEGKCEMFNPLHKPLHQIVACLPTDVMGFLKQLGTYFVGPTIVTKGEVNIVHQGEVIRLPAGGLYQTYYRKVNE
jgi:hypothetical protein